MPAEGASPRGGSHPERQNNNPLFAVRLGCADSVLSSQGQTRVLGMDLSSLPAGLLLARPFLDLDTARMRRSSNQGEEVGVASPTMTPNNSLEESFCFP